MAARLLHVVFVSLPLVLMSCQAQETPPPSLITVSGNPQHTGVYDTEPLRSFTNVRWEFETDGDATGTAVAAAGVVYLGCSEVAF
jgi:hypothetical protein